MSKVRCLGFVRGAQRPFQSLQILTVLLGLGVLLPIPAYAHHPFGGQTPEHWFTALLSGLGHPVIGVDHFVFVMAAGLLAALQVRGWMIPIGFCLTSLLGTGIHLMAVDVPMAELFIAGSVLGFGALLAKKETINGRWVTGLGAIAGLFHGYAYGEAIIGAPMTPLLAYLLGFTVIQLVIAMSAYTIARAIIRRAAPQQRPLPLRFMGFAICGVGATILSSLIVG